MAMTGDPQVTLLPDSKRSVSLKRSSSELFGKISDDQRFQNNMNCRSSTPDEMFLSFEVFKSPVGGLFLADLFKSATQWLRCAAQTKLPSGKHTKSYGIDGPVEIVDLSIKKWWIFP